MATIGLHHGMMDFSIMLAWTMRLTSASMTQCCASGCMTPPDLVLNQVGLARLSREDVLEALFKFGELLSLCRQEVQILQRV